MCALNHSTSPLASGHRSTRAPRPAPFRVAAAPHTHAKLLRGSSLATLASAAITGLLAPGLGGTVLLRRPWAGLQAAQRGIGQRGALGAGGQLMAQRLYAKASRTDDPPSMARVYAGEARWGGARGCHDGRSTARRQAAQAVRARAERGRRASTRAPRALALGVRRLSAAPAPAPAAADVNVNNPPSYWDYENLAIDWG